MVMKLLLSLFITCALAVASAAAQAQAPAPQAAQTPQVPQTPPVSINDMRDAYQTRAIFQALLRRYAPSLSEVFRLDPSLLTNSAFLAPYPNLGAFLAQHPEIAHNPGFFVGEEGVYGARRSDSPEARTYQMFENVFAGVAGFVAGVTMLGIFCWILRTVI